MLRPNSRGSFSWLDSLKLRGPWCRAHGNDSDNEQFQLNSEERALGKAFRDGSA